MTAMPGHCIPLLKKSSIPIRRLTNGACLHRSEPCFGEAHVAKRFVGHIFGKGRKHDKENDIPVYFTDIETINGPPEDATERQTIQLKSRSQLESNFQRQGHK